MNAVVYYSNTGQSKRVAEYFADKTSLELFDIIGLSECVFDKLILVFPVHCQNVPDCVKHFLKRLQVNNLAVIATYGRMCYGNVLNYIQRRYDHNIIAAAYVPTKHSYLDESGFDGFDKLALIIDKLNNSTDKPNNSARVKIPRTYKNPLSDFCKGWRSRAGVKLYKDERCDNCGACDSVCDNGAIKNGKPNRRCIRCLKCVTACPNKALHFATRLP
ncbi:MAG: EFR1 family ferrodoxin, partial [Clostridiales bacterium]|nr:EFR1 family ferrodoxin [Clostridiales bacterium]